MALFEVHLDIPPRELQRYYRGSAGVVQAADVRGRRVQFPARVLRPFVTHAGVRGRFLLEVDQRHRLLNIRRLRVDERGGVT